MIPSLDPPSLGIPFPPNIGAMNDPPPGNITVATRMQDFYCLLHLMSPFLRAVNYSISYSPPLSRIKA